MKKLFLSFFLLFSVLLNAQIQYPVTKKQEESDGYSSGTIKVIDPYRWLEDDNSPETKDWVKAQNKVTFDYLATIPIREKVRKRLEELWNYPKYSSPFKKANNYYFFKNDGLQNQSVMYRQKGLTGKPEEFLNPNTMNKEGIAALGGTSFSKTGKYFAYTIAIAGSDWKEGYIMETASKKLLTDKIQWTKFGGFSWKGDEGFFYSGYAKPDEASKMSQQNKFNMIFYHRIGTDQKDDQVIYRDNEHPLRYCNAGMTEDNRFLILTVSEGTSGNELWFIDTKNKAQQRFEPVIKGFDTESELIDNKGGKLLVLTNDNAPNYKVVLIEPEGPSSLEEEEEQEPPKK
ncbi:MAG TPA: S9 family peptidase, partial [Chitinophagaceae bacterium]